MIFDQYIKEKQAFVFELDDVLYPHKDYLLQVYYLFAQFMEYGEQLNAAEIVKYMQQTYHEAGAEGIFEKTAAKFNIPEKFKLNFDLLAHSARLPLKLLLFNDVLSFLQQIVVERKQIFILTAGEPATQLNKIKQLDWQGLEQYLVVYFIAETASGTVEEGLSLIMEKHQLNAIDLLVIGKIAGQETDVLNNGLKVLNTSVEFLNVDKLLVS